MSTQFYENFHTVMMASPPEFQCGQGYNNFNYDNPRPITKPKEPTSKGKSIVCQVPGCRRSLPKATRYHRRYKICPFHASALSLQLRPGDIDVRFCQQCATFQPVEDFDGTRKSCRKKLAIHNAKRRSRYKMEKATKAQEVQPMISPFDAAPEAQVRDAPDYLVSAFAAAPFPAELSDDSQEKCAGFASLQRAFTSGALAAPTTGSGSPPPKAWAEDSGNASGREAQSSVAFHVAPDKDHDLHLEAEFLDGVDIDALLDSIDTPDCNSHLARAFSVPDPHHHPPLHSRSYSVPPAALDHLLSAELLGSSSLTSFVPPASIFEAPYHPARPIVEQIHEFNYNEIPFQLEPPPSVPVAAAVNMPEPVVVESPEPLSPFASKSAVEVKLCDLSYKLFGKHPLQLAPPVYDMLKRLVKE